MHRISGSRLFVLIHAFFCVLPVLSAQTLQTAQTPAPASTLAPTSAPPALKPPPAQTASPETPAAVPTTPWASSQAEHVYGLQEIKPHKKGTLTLTPDALTFTGKAGTTSIPRNTITAVSSGDQRVELWGLTGRIMRMAIPNNGGMAVAAFAHHRIDMLTVEFNDTRGGNHAAVFILGANQAAQALNSFALQPKPHHTAMATACEDSLTEPGSMLITAPNWDSTQVPAAYQALMYEHLVERFHKSKSLTRIYREGEHFPQGLCPRYTLHLSITGFKEGSSVKRSMFGPLGMFVGTTQMVFNAELNDRNGTINIKEQVKSTVRGETESTNVADMVAKSLEKKYEKAVKASEKKGHGAPPPAPVPPPTATATATTQSHASRQEKPQ